MTTRRSAFSRLFERRLVKGLGDAARAGEGFYLGSFAARRALGDALVTDTDPRRIKQRLKHRIVTDGRTHLIRDKFLGAGDWAPLLDPLTGSSTHREVHDVVRAKLDYRKTFMYRTAIERAGGPKPVRRNFVALKTPELVESYFQGIVELVRSIEQSGMARRAEFRRLSHIFADPQVRKPWVEAMEADIGAAIGAEGQIYRFAPGKHRTAVAQALKLRSIPVEVRIVHASWLERQVAETGLPPVEALLHGIENLDKSKPPPGAQRDCTLSKRKKK
jgi:hypothetical protein